MPVSDKSQGLERQGGEIPPSTSWQASLGLQTLERQEMWWQNQQLNRQALDLPHALR